MKTRWLAMIMGLLFLGYLGYPMRDRALHGANDFAGFYTGASLIGRGGELYAPEANIRFQNAALGMSAPGLYYIRPPFHAVFLRPLAGLPYQTAYAVFQCLSLAAFLWFAWRFTKEMPDLWVLCAWSIPVLLSVLEGQDVLLVTAAAAGGVLHRRAGRPFLAGLFWSLCAAKFHLFLFVPVALLFRREWRMLGGGAAGGAALAVVSFAAAGWSWPLEYARMLADPAIHMAPQLSLNLRGLLFGLTGADHTAFVIAISVPLAAAVVCTLWRTRDLDTSLGVALLAGMLLSYHAFVQDGSLLLLVLVLLRNCTAPVRNLAPLAVLPPLYLLTNLGAPYCVALPAYLLVLLGLLAFTTTRTAAPEVMQNQARNWAVSRI